MVQADAKLKDAVDEGKEVSEILQKAAKADKEENYHDEVEEEEEESIAGLISHIFPYTMDNSSNHNKNDTTSKTFFWCRNNKNLIISRGGI